MVDFRPDHDVEMQQRLKTAPPIEQISPVSENRDHQNSVDALTANPVSRAQYASGSHDRTIKLWDANTHQCVRTMTGHNDGVWSLNYMSDGR